MCQLVPWDIHSAPAGNEIRPGDVVRVTGCWSSPLSAMPGKRVVNMAGLESGSALGEQASQWCGRAFVEGHRDVGIGGCSGWLRTFLRGSSVGLRSHGPKSRAKANIATDPLRFVRQNSASKAGHHAHLARRQEYVAGYILPVLLPTQTRRSSRALGSLSEHPVGNSCREGAGTSQGLQHSPSVHSRLVGPAQDVSSRGQGGDPSLTGDGWQEVDGCHRLVR